MLTPDLGWLLLTQPGLFNPPELPIWAQQPTKHLLKDPQEIQLPACTLLGLTKHS